MIRYTVVTGWRSPADGVAGLGGLTVQAHCLSRYSHYCPSLNSSQRRAKHAPSEEEIFAAMSCLKGGKAGGKNGVLPEMLKHCGANLLEYLVKLFQQVWRDGCVLQTWKNALIVPILKKGDLSICDNWRGISLLDILVESCSPIPSKADSRM